MSKKLGNYYISKIIIKPLWTILTANNCFYWMNIGFTSM